MFYRNEKERLVFNRLDFQILINDIIENISPDNIEDLNWMIVHMVDNIQLCAWEYVNNNDNFEEEWEDIYHSDYY